MFPLNENLGYQVTIKLIRGLSFVLDGIDFGSEFTAKFESLAALKHFAERVNAQETVYGNGQVYWDRINVEAPAGAPEQDFKRYLDTWSSICHPGKLLNHMIDSPRTDFGCIDKGVYIEIDGKYTRGAYDQLNTTIYSKVAVTPLWGHSSSCTPSAFIGAEAILHMNGLVDIADSEGGFLEADDYDAIIEHYGRSTLGETLKYLSTIYPAKQAFEYWVHGQVVPFMAQYYNRPLAEIIPIVVSQHQQGESEISISRVQGANVMEYRPNQTPHASFEINPGKLLRSIHMAASAPAFMDDEHDPFFLGEDDIESLEEVSITLDASTAKKLNALLEDGGPSTEA